MDMQSILPAFVGDAGGAALLGISRAGFRKFVRQGLLPAPKRLGGRTLWEVQELVAAVRRANATPIDELDEKEAA